MMEQKELHNIISWVINRKCKREDNIHVKRAVKESKSVMRITKFENDELVDRLTNEVINSCGKYLNAVGKPFPYISKLIYSEALPKILDSFMQEHLQKTLEE